LVNKESPRADMRFVSIALPRLIKKSARIRSTFEEMFLERLLHAAKSVPPETSLSEKVTQAIQQSRVSTADYRIRIALETMGKETSAEYLVIILHSLASIDDESLRNLLLMLRDYHVQMGNQGEPGKKLRFLVAGDARLWYLCCNAALDDQSP